MTPLMAASSPAYPQLEALLIQHGADPALRDWQGRTAADYRTAARTPNLEPRTSNPKPRTPNPEPNLNTNRGPRTPKRERRRRHPGRRSQHCLLHVLKTSQFPHQNDRADLNQA